MQICSITTLTKSKCQNMRYTNKSEAMYMSTVAAFLINKSNTLTSVKFSIRFNTYHLNQLDHQFEMVCMAVILVISIPLAYKNTFGETSAFEGIW